MKINRLGIKNRVIFRLIDVDGKIEIRREKGEEDEE